MVPAQDLVVLVPLCLCFLTWASDLKGFDDLEHSSGLRWNIDLVIARASLGTPGFPHAEWMSLCHP